MTVCWRVYFAGGVGVAALAAARALPVVPVSYGPQFGPSPLLLATKYGRSDIVQLFLSQGLVDFSEESVRATVTLSCAGARAVWCGGCIEDDMWI